ncbi:MAG: carbohydrate binding family 9 domain-containing protein [Phycisphaerales bacterium]|nr:MAG: carbohydrate binding family 9 domain-containing protein [Phycisphaerales bacterium]
MRAAVLGSRIFWYMLSAFSLLAFPRLGSAHDDPNAAIPALRALKVDAPLVVDGILDESFWTEAMVGTDFVDTRSGLPADQQTAVRMAYTRTHLYIAVECFDDRIEELHATELREDRFFRGDDWVEVHLDAMHTHNAKYAFFSNPLGTRVDAAEGPSAQFNTSWSVEWDLAAKIYEDRWTFEMSIPLAALNYRQEDGQTWGINFTRNLVRTDVTSFWSFNETDYFKPHNFGHLTGLDLADTELNRNLEVTPYVTSRSDFNGENNTELETGGDVNFRLTPSITSSWTVNPDFAQVEADADTIELRDTERFLPEKRLFFREGEELFNSGRDRLYYSRRFTDIDAGARVSGESNGYKFAVIDVYGDTVHDDAYYGNSSVVRLLRNVGEKSSVGLHLSNSDFKEGHSRVYANDGTLYLNDDWRFHYQVAGADDQLERDPGEEDKDRQDYYGYSSITYEKYPWEFSVDYRGISEEFNPVLGFIRRQDIFGPSFRSIYRVRSSEKWYKSMFAHFGAQYYQDGDHNASLRDYSGDLGVTLRNDMEFRLGYDDDFHRPYNNRRTALNVTLDESDYWRSMDLGWAFGVFEETEYDELVFGKRLKPIDRWPIRYEYVVRFEEEPDGDEDTIWLNRVVFDYFFSDLMWIKSAIQHRSTEVHNISVIYGWEFIKDAHLYLVYNGIREEDDTETGHSIFVKLAYTLR